MTADNVEPISDEELDRWVAGFEKLWKPVWKEGYPTVETLIPYRMAVRIRAEEKATDMWRAAESKANAEIERLKQQVLKFDHAYGETLLARDLARAEIERLRSQPNEGPIIAALREWLIANEQMLYWDDAPQRKTWACGFIDGGAAAYGVALKYLDQLVAEHAESSHAERVAEARRVLEFFQDEQTRIGRGFLRPSQR